MCLPPLRWLKIKIKHLPFDVTEMSKCIFLRLLHFVPNHYPSRHLFIFKKYFFCTESPQTRPNTSHVILIHARKRELFISFNLMTTLWLMQSSMWWPGTASIQTLLIQFALPQDAQVISSKAALLLSTVQFILLFVCLFNMLMIQKWITNVFHI